MTLFSQTLEMDDELNMGKGAVSSFPSHLGNLHLVNWLVVIQASVIPRNMVLGISPVYG